MGQLVNAVRAEMEKSIADKTEQLKTEAIAKKLEEEKIEDSQITQDSNAYDRKDEQ